MKNITPRKTATSNAPHPKPQESIALPKTQRRPTMTAIKAAEQTTMRSITLFQRVSDVG